jgi:metal-responsive CopG/Arc/MetJ family transcriptional regulator
VLPCATNGSWAFNRLGLASGLAICHHIGMARRQALVQLSDELLAQLDERGAREGRSRSDVIREAVASYLAGDLEADIDRRIVEAYARRPQEDLTGAESAAQAIIAAEPWE